FLFALDVGGALVVAQAEVHRMPQLAVRGPLGEYDMRDELGLDPMRTLVRLGPRRERAFGRLERLQQFRDARELLLVEAGAGVSGVDERSRLAIRRSRLVHAQQQRAEVAARVARLGPAADDEL